jgi:hypothetical protein
MDSLHFSTWTNSFLRVSPPRNAAAKENKLCGAVAKIELPLMEKTSQSHALLFAEHSDEKI